MKSRSWMSASGRRTAASVALLGVVAVFAAIDACGGLQASSSEDSKDAGGDASSVLPMGTDATAAPGRDSDVLDGGQDATVDASRPVGTQDATGDAPLGPTQDARPDATHDAALDAAGEDAVEGGDAPIDAATSDGNTCFGMPHGMPGCYPSAPSCCAGQCVDTMTDPQNCGSCGNACDGALCVQGSCICPLTTCGSACVDVQTDPQNCGGCFQACPSGCAAGVCLPAPEPVVTSAGYVTYIAVDSTTLYWINRPDGTVSKAPLDGGAPTTLVLGGSNGGIAIDSSNVYFANDDGLVMVPLDGGTVSTLLSGTLVSALAVDPARLYWAGGDNVGYVPLDGGAPTFLTTAGGFGVAVDATSVYWTGAGQVWSAPLSSGAPVALASGVYPSAIAVDPTSVYWTDIASAAGGSVLKTALDGGATTTLASAQGQVVFMAVDATNVYWVSNGRIFKVPLGGGAITTLASSISVTAFAIDPTSVYYGDLDETIERVPK